MKYHQEKLNLPTLGAENKVFAKEERHNMRPQRTYKISKRKVHILHHILRIIFQEKTSHVIFYELTKFYCLISFAS